MGMGARRPRESKQTEAPREKADAPKRWVKGDERQ